MTQPIASTPNIAIACGGTGGHLFPGLAVARQLIRRGCEVTLLISPKEVDQQAVKSATGMKVVTLPAVALQHGSRLAFFRSFWHSYQAARKLFKSHPPQAVLAMGGFTSAPPVLAARSVRAHRFLHESNAIPGRANRLLARFVEQAFIGFPRARSRLAAPHVEVTGTPVRPEFQPRDPAACRVRLGLDPERPVMLVMGGSQGATGINEMVLSVLPLIVQKNVSWQWFHLAGPRDAGRILHVYEQCGLKAVVHPFFSEMELALGAATACISRAGASSLAELAAMCLPTLLVPYPSAADDHQLYNARAFEKTGAAQVIEQKNATPPVVAEALTGLMENKILRDRMQTALGRWHTPRAAERIAEIIMESVSEHTSPAARDAAARAGGGEVNLRALA